jgi:CRISPR-associated DxTHG motif protein
MKLLTFLGTGDYKFTRYQWAGHETLETCYVQSALALWLDAKEIVIFVTPEAREKHQAEFSQVVEASARLTWVDTPAGRCEAELWEIFQAVYEQVPAGHEYTMDITHGFRSLPLLALLSVSFARAARQSRLKHLLYGAYEARDVGGTTPVFDLSPFVHWLDWVPAAERFRSLGDAGPLAELLKQSHRLAFRNHAKDRPRAELPQRLNNLGGLLEGIAHALNYHRPSDLAHYASRFCSEIQEIRPEVERWCRPVAPLLEELETTYSPFQGGDLGAEKELICWLHDRGRLLSAITLAREWLVSAALSIWDTGDAVNREEMERHLHQAAAALRTSGNNGDLPNFSKHPASAAILQAWNKTVVPRNDLAHWGHNRNPAPAQAVAHLAKGVVDAIRDIPLP